MPGDAPFRALIVGGGPAAVEAVLALRDLAPAIDVELLAPQSHYVYRPLATVAPFAHGEVRSYALEDLAQLGVTVQHDGLLRVDAQQRTVRTDEGRDLAYDGLLVATGAQMRRAVPRVMTFEGPGYVDAMHGLVQDVENGFTHTVAFVAPPGVSWTLPLYELALQTAQRAAAAGVDGVQLHLVSHEQRPLELLGEAASELAERLLAEAGVACTMGADLDGCIGGRPRTERTVALPVPVGRHLAGLPCDADGFLPVDGHGRVEGAASVWAAGDGTDRPIRQGGLATQQAEVAARSLAAAAGYAVETPAYEPDLRAMLVTGREVHYLHRRPGGAETEISQEPLWDPPTKIAGRRLGPFLDALDAVTPRTNRFERRVAKLRSAAGKARS